MNKLSRFALFTSLVFVSSVANAEWVSSEQAIMGTRIHVELWQDDNIDGQAAINAVMAEMRRIDELMSPHKKTSALYRINQLASQQELRISSEMFKLIARSIEFSRLTEGAFDITYASVGHLYNYRAHKRPDRKTIKKQLGKIDFHNIVLDKNRQTIRFTHTGVFIDLGGIAKGYAVDNGIKILQQRGIKSAIVSAGGDSRILGNRHGRPWMMGIRNPRKHDGLLTRLPLWDTALSTSGDYERYFIEDGVRYHHIIDPKTGDSARKLRSVTIIGPDAITTDALSTSLFIMGIERGMALANQLPDIDAIMIDNKGRFFYSNGLQEPATTKP
ncbi:MAG TPA: FAD:protein FMN transferase [Gammaproteobacteria bacterium]|nr:FAD:protein FMN transferase [Gammaproteobacteria bacterium]